MKPVKVIGFVPSFVTVKVIVWLVAAPEKSYGKSDVVPHKLAYGQLSPVAETDVILID